MEEGPVTPHAAPIFDGDGNLTYIGDDGRRYVVGLPEELTPASLERLLDDLRRGGGLIQQIESLCRRWVDAVAGGELDRRGALLLLLTSLEASLGPQLEDADGPEADGSTGQEGLA
ncbi:MAG: hypothetical protein VKI83_01630 [Synechococcaceae cyanobacterium]|nr:hypothetical protein [Synechococcaceae cyanobacterium]